MNTNSEIVAVVSQGLLRAAIRHLIKTYANNADVMYISSLKNCIDGKFCPAYLILESNSIPEPVCFSLEKIRSKNKHGEILLIENNPINDAVKSFVSDVLYINDNEEIIIEKLRRFFIRIENSHTFHVDDTISDREKEIVKLVALGKTNKEISDILFISPHTVITHRKNITAKLGIKTIAGLTVYAILNNLIETDELSAE
ncbi:MAG: hypothetical protein JXA77_07880 [Bacteroidales bacterium]|nr:hypothetical protein [Bacteroidales bacterium]MBN2819515.1 hypothetical protein [Bacteroidales bacterium]